MSAYKYNYYFQEKRRTLAALILHLCSQLMKGSWLRVLLDSRGALSVSVYSHSFTMILNADFPKRPEKVSMWTIFCASLFNSVMKKTGHTL